MDRAGHPASAQTRTHIQRRRLARRYGVATAAYAQRRRIATVFAVVIAVLVGYHALFGANGVVAYRAKRSEDRLLAQQLEKMKQENSRLKAHVDHLKSDPDAIAYEAQMRLRYTRPDQVIVLNNAPNTATQVRNTGSQAPNGSAQTPQTPSSGGKSGSTAH